MLKARNPRTHLVFRSTIRRSSGSKATKASLAFLRSEDRLDSQKIPDLAKAIPSGEIKNPAKLMTGFL